MSRNLPRIVALATLVICVTTGCAQPYSYNNRASGYYPQRTHVHPVIVVHSR